MEIEGKIAALGYVLPEPFVYPSPNRQGSVRAAVGDLDRVRQVVKVVGYVNTAPGFERQFAVIDGASDLFLALWGERGSHTRSAVGVFELPRGFPVEVEAVFAIEDDR